MRALAMRRGRYAPGLLTLSLISSVACVGKIENGTTGAGAVGNGTLAYAMVRLTNNQYLKIGRAHV